MGEIKRPTLWAVGMPTPGDGQRWRHEGGNYYVDVTGGYVPAEQLQVAAGTERDRIVRQINRAAIEYPRSSPERVALLNVATSILKGES